MRGEVDKLKILLALIFIFQGLSIAVLAHPLVNYTHPAMRLVGVFLMVAGILYIYFKYKFAREIKAVQKEKGHLGAGARADRLKKQIMMGKAYKRAGGSKPEPEDKSKSILTKFMEWIFEKTEAISPYMLPIIGAIIIDAVIIYNILIRRAIELHGFDAITIAFGVSVILYNYIPKQYSFARDFLVFFLGLLFFIMIFPPIFYDFMFGTGGNAAVTKIFLGDPLVGLLNLGGIESSSKIIISGSDGKETATVFFVLANGKQAAVGIAEGCSGIFTASIFLSAFITFVLLEYRRFDRKVGLVIGLGIFTTYAANIFRMTIIILVGHYYDTDPGDLAHMSWAHINAGWLIFLAWIIPFWLLMYKYLMKSDLGNSDEGEKNGK